MQMRDFADTVSFPARVLKETPKALLCAIGGREVWIAKSQIDYSASEARWPGDSGALVVSAWLARKLDLNEPAPRSAALAPSIDGFCTNFILITLARRTRMR